MSTPGSSNDIVITGLGLATVLGGSASASWEALASGRVARGRLEGIEGEGFERAKCLADVAVIEALRQARVARLDPERLAATFSASKPFVGETITAPDRITDHVAEQFDFRGERRNVIAACATGPYSVALAASWISEGLCDVALAGSVEAAPHPLIEAGFSQMGVLSPDQSTRPFDARRSGFAIGEGSGAVVLESADHAAARGQKVLARLSGWALGADGHSAVAFNSNGQKISNVIDRALKRAGLSSDQIRHVNAHGTATRLNDVIETQALEKAFGAAAGRLMISATKSSTGHLLGAAGSVEFVFTILALQHQFVPPTAQLEIPDPECRLDYTPGHGHAADFDHALNLSFGFGGPIGALVVSR